MGIVGCTGNVFWSVLRGNWAVACLASLEHGFREILSEAGAV